MPWRPAAGPATALVAGMRGLQCRRWAWPLGVAALAGGGWLLWLPYLGFPLDDDMTGYATAAYWWARGDTHYRGITVPLPQGIIVVFRLIEAAGLGSIRGIGLGAATLFTLILATPYLQGYTANAELFMLLPFLGCLSLLRADHHSLDSRPGRWLLAAVALLSKPVGVAVLALAALWLLRRRRVEGASWRAWLRAHAAPDETVYVAYQRASIYYLSERRPATRWLDLPQLVWTPGAWDQQLARLGNPATAPRYIVEPHPFDYADRDADGTLRAIVARDYTLKTTIGGAHAYRRKD